jgi:adenosylcobinamide-GDP ribazoletransferase
MSRQWQFFCFAVQFLTRLPVRADFQPDSINRSARYFPIVGQLIGLPAAVVLVVTAQFWSNWIAAALALLTTALLTGALHEDGLADTADGFAGGHNPAQRLAIMKDSATGTYGTLAVIFCTLLKLSALASLTHVLAACSLIAAHGVARAATVTIMHGLPYAGDPGSAKLSTQNAPPTIEENSTALILAAWPLFLLHLPNIILGLALCAAVTWGMARLSKKLIGGQRGDVLGAVEQLCETAFLLGCAAHFA